MRAFVLMQTHSVLRDSYASGLSCHPPACDPLSEMPAGAVGLNIVIATRIFDREALTGSDNEQPAAWSKAAEWKSVATGLSGVTSPLLTETAS
ncbi:hypothetical protein PBY51_015127 [Eleginops maclovinus]|uniref:Uncharacterized protein n=1 Tax=Eleginops maclovinus TaxID=56733 RepID=A0AAN8ABN5_ELEMC|nr:hypothetical protein PBY51_015127 [Eleginops maclovinus]